MEDACSKHGRYEKMHINFQTETLKRRDHLEVIGTEQSITLDLALRK
jgi:hypothetical protein